MDYYDEVFGGTKKALEDSRREPYCILVELGELEASYVELLQSIGPGPRADRISAELKRLRASVYLLSMMECRPRLVKALRDARKVFRAKRPELAEKVKGMSDDELIAWWQTDPDGLSLSASVDNACDALHDLDFTVRRYSDEANGYLVDFLNGR